jgi:hypothetical protein
MDNISLPLAARYLVWFVISNHYHLVIKTCPDQLEERSDDDIMDQWCALFKGRLPIQTYRLPALSRYVGPRDPVEAESPDLTVPTFMF